MTLSVEIANSYAGSYLDLPDLACLAQAVPSLSIITSDPVLHLQRLRIINPSRVNHSLFGTSPEGHGLRPSVGDLVHRGVICGLNIERRWRMGTYFYSRDVSNRCSTLQGLLYAQFFSGI